MSGHTAGPWKAKGPNGKYDNRKNTWDVEDETKSCSMAAPITLANGKVVAFAVKSFKGYHSDTSDLDANAQLIAAAPTMLSAIEQFEKWWTEVGQVSFNGAPACVFALREAAALARGEP